MGSYMQLRTLLADLEHKGQDPASDSLREEPQCKQHCPAVMTLGGGQYNEVCQPQQLAAPEDCLLLCSQPADADWANAAR